MEEENRLDLEAVRMSSQLSPGCARPVNPYTYQIDISALLQMSELWHSLGSSASCLWQDSAAVRSFWNSSGELVLLLSCWWCVPMDNFLIRIRIFTSLVCVNVRLFQQLTESWHSRYDTLLNWLALQILLVQSNAKFVSSGTCTQWWNALIFASLHLLM